MDTQSKEPMQTFIDNLEVHATGLPNEYWKFIHDEILLNGKSEEEIARHLEIRICIVKHIVRLFKIERDLQNVNR